jgi:hypothetical protein
MALLLVDDLRSPIYNASLWPWRLSGRSRPIHFRVDDPVLRHCASGCGDQGHHGHPRRYYDLLKVGIPPQQRRDLGCANVVSGAPITVVDRDERLFGAHIQQLQSYNRPWLTTKLQDTNMLKVPIYLTWCMRRNLH